MVHCVSSKYSHHQIWKSIGATFPFIFLGRLWNCVGQDQGAHLRSTTKAMPLTLPTDTIVTNQSLPSKTIWLLLLWLYIYKTKLWRFKTSNSRWTCNHWIPNKNRLKFDNFFGICAHFALKCDLPPIVRGMMMHKLEILSKSYFRASDIEAVLTATIYYSFFEKLTHVQCTHATLIKLIYNLQENHIPTEVLWQGQASAKKLTVCKSDVNSW